MTTAPPTACSMRFASICRDGLVCACSLLCVAGTSFAQEPPAAPPAENEQEPEGRPTGLPSGLERTFNYRFLADRPAACGAGVTSSDIAVEVVGAFANPGEAVLQSSGRTANFGLGMLYFAYSF